MHAGTTFAGAAGAARAAPLVSVTPLLSARRGQPRRASSMVATSIFFIDIIASKARLASAPPVASASVSARGVICQERPRRSVHPGSIFLGAEAAPTHRQRRVALLLLHFSRGAPAAQGRESVSPAFQLKVP